MMPVRTQIIPGGARVLIFTCEGGDHAALFGEDCDVLAAIRTGNAAKAGRWWCGRRKDGSLYCKEAIA